MEATSLAAALRRLAADKPELGVQLERAPGLRPVADVVGGRELDTWLDNTTGLANGTDPRTAAAYLMSIFVWRLGEILGSLYLAGASLPRLAAEDIAVSQVVIRRVRKADIDFRFGVLTDVAGRPFDREVFAASIIAIHAPLISALHQRTGLPTQALWRLVTDGVSAGMLAYGKRTGCLNLAREEAEAVLAVLPLANPQWRFVEIVVDGVAPEWFRLRGGCCRLYKTEGTDYCTTCVLRSDEDQIERLRARLRARLR